MSEYSSDPATGNPDKDKFLKGEDDECDTVDKFSIFIDWLRASGGNHEQLTLQKYADEMRGVHATRDVAPDETICTIPLKCLITVEMGKSTEVGRKVSMHNLQLDAPKHVYVMLFMLMDMQDPESFFRPYYDVLPETLNSMPVFWSEEELSWLQGSYMVSQTRDRKDAIARDYRNICGIAPEFESAVTLQQFIWARMIVCSRNFGIIVNGLRTSAMVPYADMLNHLRPRECKWEFEDDIQAFTITSLEHMKAGAQVYDSYGKKCNYRFLLNYGFAMENNIEADGSSPNEFSVCFEESRSGATDPLAEERFGLWRVLPPMQQVHSKRLRLDANVRSAPARQAFAILRVLNANAAEMAHMKAPAATPEFPSRRRPSAQEPMSLRNEIAMLHALRDLMASMLAAYPRTLEEDDKMLAEDTTLEPFSNQRHALLLVRGEKQVLRYYADFASKCLEVLAIESPVERGAAAARLTGQQDRPSQAAGVHLNEDLGAMLSSDTADADFRSFEELIRPGVPSAAEGESVEIGGGLVKRVIRQPAGPASAFPPTEFCTVAAHYRIVSLRTGSVAHDTRASGRGPIRLLLDEAVHVVPAGVVAAMRSMRQGERALVRLPSAMAHGTTGGAAGEDGEDGDEFEADISLYLVVPDASMTADGSERLESAQEMRQMGNDKYRVSDFASAMRRYSRALEILGAGSGDDAVSDEERLMLHLNLAMCNLKLGDNDSAVEDCDHALEIDSGNVKGLFRRGCAYLKLNNLEAAAADLRKAQELDPTNAGVKKELRALALQQKAAKEKEREMAARMFG